MIHQGDVYWAEIPGLIGSAPSHRRPFVVIQSNVLNSSRLRTVMVCAITSSLRHATAPGNVLLRPGEANLRVQSVVNVTQVFTFDRSRLEELIGTLSQTRVREIVRGIQRCIDPMASPAA